MKRINLFWKTWIITIMTIMLSLGIFVGYIYVSTITFIDMKQEARQHADVKRIKEYIEIHGIDVEYLNNELQKGNIVQIFDETGQDIYPANSFSGLIIASGSNTASPEYNEGENFTEVIMKDSDIFTFNEDPYDIVSINQTFLFQDKEYTLQFFFPGMIQKNDILASIQSIVPGFLIVAMLVSGIASFLYANYFSSKIKKLNLAIDDMGSMKELPIIEVQGDELQQLENNLYQMYGKLQQAMQKLEAENGYSRRLEEDRSLFMKGATHELKTPIMTMSSMIEGMLEQVLGYENHDEYLVACNLELQKMTQLVQEILEVARLEHLRFDGQTNLAQAITEVLQDYQYLISDSELILDVELDETILVSMTNKNAKKIISNLISNSVKYSPKGRLIKINLNKKQLNIENDMYPGDTEMPDIMSAFSTYQYPEIEDVQGHGLGLYIVDYILKQYDLMYVYDVDVTEHKFNFTIFL